MATEETKQFFVGGDRAVGKVVCGRFMSPAWETQSMWEIRLLRWRLPRKGGGVNRYAIKAVFILACMILTVLVVRGTDYISSCKSNYHTITTTVAPVIYVC